VAVAVAAQEPLRAHQEVLAVAVAIMLLARRGARQPLDKVMQAVLRLTQARVRLVVAVVLALSVELEQVALPELVVLVRLQVFLVQA
jgi:hypothetical protein